MHAIAIDGPAGAGKSTIAKAVAGRLGYIYVDTGAMYRTVGLYLLRNGIDINDEKKVGSAMEEINIDFSHTDDGMIVKLNTEDVTGLIRTEAVSEAASACSVYGTVRQKLVMMQRDIAKRQNVVMDGRDIGTVVLPDADTKIYLVASAKTRAKRRHAELVEKSKNRPGRPDTKEKKDIAVPDIDVIEADILKRDERDMTRKNSPLTQAGDAVLIDSSDMTIEEVTNRVMEIAMKK